MNELLTSAQIRAIETSAIDTGIVTGSELMERSGRGVFEAILSEFPELAASMHRAVVLCGPGHNGGDGFVVARLLKQWGWRVWVYLLGNVEDLPVDARKACEAWREFGEVHPFSAAPHFSHEADLYIDALFGTGLARPLPDEVLEWLDARQADPNVIARTLAVDLPSGLCGDSGRALGKKARAVQAGLTVSFHALRVGHMASDGPKFCGRLKVVDIGLPRKITDAYCREVKAPKAALLSKAVDGHKYAHGHAVVVAGGPGAGGAARLAARSALRVGAGLVTVACAPTALAENAARLDAIMLRVIDSPKALAAVLEDERITALCIGPGLGLSAGAAGLVGAAIASKRPVVLDADALSLLAEREELFGMLHPACLLTPHTGEFRTLFPAVMRKFGVTPKAGPAYSKVDAAREAAVRAGCKVVFKGPDTVIADETGAAWLHSARYARSAPWLATAGSGDVLAGLIAGLLARGQKPLEAAAAGVWLHVEAARRLGPGLIAEDLAEALPGVLRDLPGVS